MKKTKTIIEGLYVIKQKSFNDKRGQFLQCWNEKTFNDLELNQHFNHDNISTSHKNVIRGLHFQSEPHSQLKLVHVIKGSVIDVVVDLRKSSKTFGEHFSIELSSINHLMLWIPKGCAHGFKALEENTIFHYKCCGEYKPNYEKTILWNDLDLNINWGDGIPLLSKKDLNGISFNDYKKQILK